MPPAHRRSKSDADLKYAAADPNPALTNLFRREPEVSSSKSTQALQNLVVNLESQLGEAYHEIRVMREERDEMARERDEQRQILHDAERQMDEILHRHHHVTVFDVDAFILHSHHLYRVLTSSNTGMTSDTYM